MASDPACPPNLLGPLLASLGTVASSFPQVLLNGTVFARMSPAQKSSLVEEFQKLEWVPSRDPGRRGGGLSWCPLSPSGGPPPLLFPGLASLRVLTSDDLWGTLFPDRGPKGCCKTVSWVSPILFLLSRSKDVQAREGNGGSLCPRALWKGLLAVPEGREEPWRERNGCPPRLCAAENTELLGALDVWQPHFQPEGRRGRWMWQETTWVSLHAQRV